MDRFDAETIKAIGELTEGLRSAKETVSLLRKDIDQLRNSLLSLQIKVAIHATVFGLIGGAGAVVFPMVVRGFMH